MDRAEIRQVAAEDAIWVCRPLIDTGRQMVLDCSTNHDRETILVTVPTPWEVMTDRELLAAIRATREAV